ncbi:MAG: hypothetical protein IKP67_09385, partial [Spirochaetales bacterium]|nr:hypothetical protein [Spirochaetales bacterium]
DGYQFLLVSDTFDPDTGANTVRWQFIWDSSKISGIAKADVVVTVKASDAVGNTDAVDTDTYRIDVVPYITSVETKLSALGVSNPSVYNRTALGHYSVHGGKRDDSSSAETISISGLNLGTLSALNAADISSGEYNPLVNTVSILNNKNNNTVEYNLLPNGVNNNLLNDDVIFDVWQINPQAVKPKFGKAIQPVMAISPTDRMIGFAFVNGTAFFSMAYGTPKTGKGGGTPPNSYEYWIGGLDAWNSIGFTYDSDGYSYGLVAGGDINTAKNGVDIFRFTTSRWDGKGTLATNGYENTNNQFGLEFIGQREFYYSTADETWDGFTSFDKDRIRSPSISVISTGSNKAKVYIAYYDAINDEIRFRCGEVTSSRANKPLLGNYYSDRVSKAYSLNYLSLIAGQTTNKYVSSNYNATEKVAYTKVNDIPQPVTTAVTTTSGEAVCAGEYVSIVALNNQGTSDDAVVAVWWDAVHKQLLYSYNKTPNSILAGTFSQSDTKWEKPEPIFNSGIGEYCKVTADKKYGIHIAAYDSLNGDLWYAYVEDFDNPSGVKTGLIDSYSFVGAELNIDVVMNEQNDPVPYISYYATSCGRPKLAYWNGSCSLSESENINGAEDEKFTHNWESGIVPTISKVSTDHINIGLWKNASGVATYSTTDGTAPVDSNIGVDDVSHIGSSVPTVNSYGTVYGNGSKNPVLGYAITQGSLGYIETAQMK